MDDEEQAPKSPKVLAVAAGPGIYYAAVREAWWPLWLSGVLFVVGAICLLVGLGVIHRVPVLAVWLIQLWLTAPVAIGAVASAGAIWAVVLAQTHFKRTLPDADGDTLTQWVSVAILGGLGWLILGLLSDKESPLWPARITQKAFVSSFAGFDHTSIEYQAVNEPLVRVDPEIRGWSLHARQRRAWLIFDKIR
ncbi:hypothetical protein ACIQKB_36775 [Streptomyces sp. NPDC092046]|uniref:hypothetical protein n=1 Tax=Streptomyces sp. NPDC092046 TaxID=3366009 RepID=UPI00380A02D3